MSSLTRLGKSLVLLTVLLFGLLVANSTWYMTSREHDTQASQLSGQTTYSTATASPEPCELLAMRVINYVQEQGVALIVFEDYSVRRANDAPIRADLLYAIEFVNAMPDDLRYTECADGRIGASTYS